MPGNDEMQDRSRGAAAREVSNPANRTLRLPAFRLPYFSSLVLSSLLQ
jgi:hypothetical protein